jgi:hypothetical protein
MLKTKKREAAFSWERRLPVFENLLRLLPRHFTWKIDWARRMRPWHWGPVRCRDSLRVPHSAGAAALCNFVIRCDGPVRFWDSLRLPKSAGAGALSDDGTLCDWPDMLALGPYAILRFLADPKALALGPMQCWIERWQQKHSVLLHAYSNNPTTAITTAATAHSVTPGHACTGNAKRM